MSAVGTVGFEGRKRERMGGEPVHTPVLVDPVLRYLAPVPGEVFVDATVGLGGHAGLLLEKLRPGGRLYGIDRDPQALDKAKGRLGESADSTLVHGDFRDLARILDEADLGPIHGFLFDLGASSFQFGTAERGFSFASEGPLDMRMDPSETTRTAAELVATLSEQELANLFFRYGEEPASRRIAREIVRCRAEGAIESTTCLAEIVRRAVGRPRERIHPATRVFQALRIAVNRELEAIEVALPAALARLARGGRLAVVSFHSLEDRIVKNLFREMIQARAGWSMPVARPIFASPEEVAANPRSRSARLRVLVRGRGAR